MKQKLVLVSKIFFILSIVYIAVLAGGFFAIKFGFTNASSEVDPYNKVFEESNKKISKINKSEKKMAVKNKTLESFSDSEIKEEIEKLTHIKKTRGENYCKISALGTIHPVNAKKIVQTYESTNDSSLVASMIIASSLRLKEKAGFQDIIKDCEKMGVENKATLFGLKEEFGDALGANVFPWINDEVWDTIREATRKDEELINKAGEVSGVEPRLIVANMIVEQLRLFNSQRELVKKFFKPLKILGNATKMSLGVMGIKEATAIQIENHLKDPFSEYYLGKEFEHVLDFTTNNPSQERYERLTDEKNHYYSYLYGALYLRQILEQWKKAGHDIGNRPEISGTLFNVGFPQSNPKPDPKIGGSKINIGEGSYTFGSLVYEFYYSGELSEEFPYIIQ